MMIAVRNLIRTLSTIKRKNNAFLPWLNQPFAVNHYGNGFTDNYRYARVLALISGITKTDSKRISLILYQRLSIREFIARTNLCVYVQQQRMFLTDIK